MSLLLDTWPKQCRPKLGHIGPCLDGVASVVIVQSHKTCWLGVSRNVPTFIPGPVRITLGRGRDFKAVGHEVIKDVSIPVIVSLQRNIPL